MSARLLHYARWTVLRDGKTLCKTLETACGHFRRSVAATVNFSETTCRKCIEEMRVKDSAYAAQRS